MHGEGSGIVTAMTSGAQGYGNDLADRIFRVESELAELRAARLDVAQQAQGYGLGLLHADIKKILDTMATKVDLAQVRAEMATKAEVGELAQEMVDIRGDLATLADRFGGQVAELRGEVAGGFAAIQRRLDQLAGPPSPGPASTGPASPGPAAGLRS